jgi:uncharacterized membrane-anchored protein YhcB (DUF1043 family)
MFFKIARRLKTLERDYRSLEKNLAVQVDRLLKRCYKLDYELSELRDQLNRVENKNKEDSVTYVVWGARDVNKK